MIVKIFFQEDGKPGKFQHVANVAIPLTNITRGLEYAYTSTQNISGSWSRGPMIDNVENPDFDECVKVLVPLPVYGGKTYGLRSSMVGDVFSVNDELYKVDFVGFTRVASLESCVTA